MASRTLHRPLTAARLRFISPSTSIRSFSQTRSLRVISVGDSIPSLPSTLREGAPANHVNLATEISSKYSGRGVIVGVPGAFSPGCTAKHVPSYLKHPNIRDSGGVFVVAVNDPFVVKAWGEVVDPGGISGVRFLADPEGEFTKALDLELDKKQIFGNIRSKRYALVVEDGKVISVHIEPDGTGTSETMADKVLGPPLRNDWNA